MEHPNESLFEPDAQETPAELAAALAPAALPGHYDELRGIGVPAAAGTTGPVASVDAPLTPAWETFFGHLGQDGFGDLDRRTLSLRRQVRDNGITYNVYADGHGPQRPWAVDLFPLILTPQCWERIEAGVLQRTRLLEGIMADVYGPQRLLSGGLLPSALVQGHPGYLRSMHGVVPVGGTHLHIAAFDMARDDEGDWWVVSQRTQAPSGLGYLLENRLLVSRLFPEAFGQMPVQHLAATYRALLDSLRQRTPAGADARIVLLTPGPYNETYFEHAYLARYLGLTLVEGSDLTVRGEHLYLKTLHGLQPVHGILKRLDDEFLDPLELRSDSRLGVPGLLQAIRAGNVLVANAPGSAFLESTALLGFLPALSRELLGEELALPSLPTWWCGEDAARKSVLPHLAQSVIRPTWPGVGARGEMPVLCHALSRAELTAWAERIEHEGDAYTVQAYQPLSQMPTWRNVPGGRNIAPRSVMLRVFAVSDGPGAWRVLPGGLARIATGTHEITSMQRGGSSADVWALTDGAVDTTTLLPAAQAAPAVAHRSRQVTSRSAENLFWLGRYTERAENTIRLARLALQSLNGEDQSSQPLLAWLSALAQSQGLVTPGVPGAAQGRRVFERSLIAGLADTTRATSVGYNLRGIKSAAAAVRDRLSQEQWNLIVRAEADFFQQCPTGAHGGDFSAPESLRVLEVLSGHMAAMTGAQTDRMMRDDGWRLLSIGRHIERLGFLADALARGFDSSAVADEGGFDAIVALFDSTITFRAQYQLRHDVPALVDLLVLDPDNPRSLAWVAQTLRGRLRKLHRGADGHSAAPSVKNAPDAEADMGLFDPAALSLEALCTPDAAGSYPALAATLARCAGEAWRLSDRLGARYFTHSGDQRQSLGT
ncbi:MULTISPECIES: circularly permuted type 2 ATP-grasp protein [unclassified Acidovorax]|uniref:circularly permuted type 2 ATP-grasp protein n=1 Tax=unclassified Acidovorax TaxID=2684926 RepID=UPI002882F580|nr:MULTISPECIES: circularly permuted type 2 ATP-grasp protein [unclassified Acidovorax]